MRYAILANPVAGTSSVEEKTKRLARAAEVLEAEIHGLQTRSREDFIEAARRLSRECDVLVAAGGDGTFSEAVNAVDLEKTVLAYLPLGTGNALRHTFEYKGSLEDMARRIQGAPVRRYDLIDCDGKRRAFMASVGIEGAALQISDDYRARGRTGSWLYFKATMQALLWKYRAPRARLSIDGESLEYRALLSLVIMKQPYYGLGFKLAPEARFDDGRLHALAVGWSIPSIAGFLGHMTFRARTRAYRSAREVAVSLDRPLRLQYDGTVGWEDEAFRFSVLPGALKVKC
jgi:diacylglycerol kinase (ATP)